MESQEQIKEMVRQKYSEIALQDKDKTKLPAAVPVVAPLRYII